MKALLFNASTLLAVLLAAGELVRASSTVKPAKSDSPSTKKRCSAKSRRPRPTVTVTETCAPTTVTLPSEETLTIPGAEKITTVSVTLEITSTASETITVTIPGDDVTQTTTETVVQTTSEALPTTKVEISTAIETVTETQTTIVPVTAVETLTATETVTQTESFTTTESAIATESFTRTSTETRSATVTEVATTTTTVEVAPTSGPCSLPIGANAVINPGFESSLAGTWTLLAAGDVMLERIFASGAPGSSYSMRSRISATNPNLPQRIVQSVAVCPGADYQVSFMARRATTAGTGSVTAYVNDTPLAGGVITATTFTSVAQINSAIFSTASSSVVVRVEFAYSGGAGSAKELIVDDIVVKRLS